MRVSVYPKLVAAGKMSHAVAEVELERMLQIGLVMEALEQAVATGQEELAKLPADQPRPKVSLILDTLTGYVDMREKEIKDQRDKILVARPGPNGQKRFQP
jgi:hypothetical protein